MFTGFFYQFTLCDPLAHYVLRMNVKHAPGNPNIEQKYVGFDENHASEGLAVRRYLAFRLLSRENQVYFRVNGLGNALCDTQLFQDKAYFEVKIVRIGCVFIGVAHPNRSILTESGESESWGLNFPLKTGNFQLQPGDIIGCLVDQSEFPGKIRYLLNGNAVGEEATGLRGALVPVVGLKEDSEVEVSFQEELIRVPEGYSAVISSQSHWF